MAIYTITAYTKDNQLPDLNGVVNYLEPLGLNVDKITVGVTTW